MGKNQQYGVLRFKYRGPRISSRSSRMDSNGHTEHIPPARLIGAEAVGLAECYQPEKLKLYMEQAALTHGQTVLANLNNVRIERGGQLYFCPMEELEIVQHINGGDGNEIPEEATLIGNPIIKHFIPGHFNIKNVVISSNGKMQVIAQPETVWEQINEYAY